MKEHECWRLITPGLKRWAESKSCELWMDGVNPAIINNGISTNIDVNLIEGCFDRKDYEAIENHIKSLCEEK
jgi:hypothetical protein